MNEKRTITVGATQDRVIEVTRSRYSCPIALTIREQVASEWGVNVGRSRVWLIPSDTYREYAEWLLLLR